MKYLEIILRITFKKVDRLELSNVNKWRFFKFCGSECKTAIYLLMFDQGILSVPGIAGYE